MQPAAPVTTIMGGEVMGKWKTLVGLLAPMATSMPVTSLKPWGQRSPGTLDMNSRTRPGRVRLFQTFIGLLLYEELAAVEITIGPTEHIVAYRQGRDVELVKIITRIDHHAL